MALNRILDRPRHAEGLLGAVVALRNVWGRGASDLSWICLAKNKHKTIRSLPNHCWGRWRQPSPNSNNLSFNYPSPRINVDSLGNTTAEMCRRSTEANDPLHLKPTANQLTTLLDIRGFEESSSKKIPPTLPPGKGSLRHQCVHMQGKQSDSSTFLLKTMLKEPGWSWNWGLGLRASTSKPSQVLHTRLFSKQIMILGIHIICSPFPIAIFWSLQHNTCGPDRNRKKYR